MDGFYGWLADNYAWMLAALAFITILGAIVNELERREK